MVPWPLNLLAARSARRPENFIAPFRGKVTDEEAKYLGMVANLDYNIGRLMAFLKEKNLDKNTIVILMSDNGQTWGWIPTMPTCADAKPRHGRAVRAPFPTGVGVVNGQRTKRTTSQPTWISSRRSALLPA